MKNRLSRLLKVLEWYPRSGTPDVDALALQLGTTPGTVRRDLRDLRDAGAFASTDAPGTAEPVATLASEDAQAATAAWAGAVLGAKPANDGDEPAAITLCDDELAAMYVGARFLASEGDAEACEAAYAVIARVEHAASPAMLERLAALDTRFRFGPRTAERRVRALVSQAITERRVLAIRYKGAHDGSYRLREVEPLAQFFIHDRWTFIAYCRLAGDIRQFRHERCRDAKLTEQYFTERSGVSLDAFIRQRRRPAAGQTG